jgi:oxygen-independent coproporphyrinogen-3 oxidase
MSESFVPREVEEGRSDFEPAPLDFARDERAVGTEEALALYVHWPFCVSKCPYCDFNSHVREAVDQDRWREALLADLAYEAAQAPDRQLGSIFFGGGTPSLMPPSTVAAIVEAAEAHWGFVSGIEITLEANPSSVEASRFAALATAGVNRVSLGLQSLDDEALRFLGRAHGAQEGLAALATAQSVFERVSFDLIYALPDQSERAWEYELRKALSFGTGHLSLYQLTIEPGTRFAALAAKGELPHADPDRSAGLYELTQELTAAAGLPSYEISNHARPGEESRHNLAYWRYQPYLGVGPGAHGRRAGAATQRHKKPENWLAALFRNGHGIVEETPISPADCGVEALLMGLRLREGIDLRRIERLSGRAAEALIGTAAIAKLQSQGLVELTSHRLRVTEAGMLLLDAILAEIVR